MGKSGISGHCGRRLRLAGAVVVAAAGLTAIAPVASTASAATVTSAPAPRVFHASNLSPQLVTRAIRRVAGGASSAISGNGRGAVDVNVAVLDSGVDGTHRDLDVRGGINCLPSTPTTRGATIDPYGHGTMVAGVIGARDNGIDVVGVAPGAHIWSARVLDKNGNGEDYQVLCGIDWAIHTHHDADPANDIQVINMSLAGPGEDDGACGRVDHDAIHAAVCAAVRTGIVVVAAAGNDGGSFTHVTPAAYREVLTVTGIQDTDGLSGGHGPQAVDAGGCDSNIGDDVAADFSNFATRPADFAHVVAAPSTCIGGLWPGNQVATWDGTSFAAPSAAGTVAVCIASGKCAGLAPARVVAKIVADSQRYNTRHHGYGYAGDPIRPVKGRYYGYLLRAGDF